MSQRLSKICVDSDLEEDNNTYEIDNYKNNENGNNNKIILFFNELFYDLYFKYTDIKFYFECLDDDDKAKIYKVMLSLALIIIIISIIFIYILVWKFIYMFEEYHLMMYQEQTYRNIHWNL